MRKNKPMIVAFLLPSVIAYLVIFIYPTVRTTFMSFFAVDNITDAISTWEFVGIGNYVTLFQSELFIVSMTNIVKIWVYGGIGTFILSLIFAVILTSGVKGKSFYRAIIYLPNVVSAVAMGTMWIQYVYSPKYGLLKKAFEFLGLESLAKIQWTGPDTIFTAMLIAYCFGMVGYFMLIFMAAIEGIPTSFYEAATIAGAGIIKKFVYITLPLLKDVFRTNIVLWTTTTLAFFIWSKVFSPQNPVYGTVTPMVYMYQSVFGANMVVTERNVGAGAAVGVILTVIVIAMFYITSRLLKDDQLEY